MGSLNRGFELRRRESTIEGVFQEMLPGVKKTVMRKDVNGGRQNECLWSFMEHSKVDEPEFWRRSESRMGKGCDGHMVH